MPKISIIVPVYNVEEYLVKCLDSLVNQTLKDIEIICINDGSTDFSPDILQCYAKKDSRIKVIDKENEGVSAARNTGLDAATGDYILFVDSDDWIDQTTCEQVYAKIVTDSSDLVVFKHISVSNSKAVEVNFLDKLETCINFKFSNAPDDFYYIITGACAKLYKNTNLRFHKNLIKGEDTNFFWEYCLKFNPKISILDKSLYYYLQRENSAMNNADYSNKCYVFEACNSLINTELFKGANQKVQIKILDRYAQSVNLEIRCFEKYLSKNYYKKLKTFCKLFEKYDKNDLQNLRFYPQVKRKIHIFLRKIMKFAQFFFRITNAGSYKKITILGITLKINRFNRRQKQKEKYYIKKIKKNQKKYLKDSYLLFDLLNQDRAECIDAYSLFQYMKSSGKKAYYVLFEDSFLYNELKEQNKLDGIIAIKNPITTNAGDFYEAVYDVILRSKAVISAFGVFTKNSQKFMANAKFFKYIFIQHGPTFLKDSVLTNKYLTPKQFDKILISSDMEYKVFKKYGWEDKKFLKCGLPRWDLLSENSQQDKEKCILVMFTWRNFDLLSFQNSMYKQNINKFLNNKNFNEYLVNNKLKLYFIPHHSLKGLCNIDFQIDNSNIEILHECNISQYIRKCSCFVTDFSSVAFDFMFQNKPVVYYIPDKGDICLDEHERKGIDSFEYKQYIMPNVFFDQNSVIEKIKYYVENDFKLEDEVKVRYDRFFYTKEDIRAKLTQQIDEICK